MLALIDARREAHAPALELIELSVRGEIDLFLSTVNLAEVLQHARRYLADTGFDAVSMLLAFGVEVVAPDVAMARNAALLSDAEDCSLADRFAAAAASVLGARLYTTDRTLADALSRRRDAPPVTLLGGRPPRRQRASR